jgi:hypothetical protein
MKKAIWTCSHPQKKPVSVSSNVREAFSENNENKALDFIISDSSAVYNQMIAFEPLVIPE